MRTRMVPPDESRRVRGRDLALLALFFVFWILPLTYQGVSGRRPPGSPDCLAHLTNVSCLFSKSYSAWTTEYIEIQPGPGLPWVEVPEKDYFAMEVFGHRTKLNNIAIRGLPEAAFAEAALYVRAKYKERHPLEPPPFVVRFVTVSAGDLRRPLEGAWQDPPLSAIPIAQRRVWYTGIFRDPSVPPAGPQ